MKISCIALAGGKSTRLGRDKLSEMIGGETLIERVLHKLVMLNGEIILVASTTSSFPSIENYPQIRIVKDIYPGSGSLGAIYTGLSYSQTQYNLMVACDMPFLNPELLRYMIEISCGYDFVAFNQNDRPEPLHAVYSLNCLAPMKSLIEQKTLRIIGILPYVKVRYITQEEIERFDPLHLSFYNINTEEELEKAREIAGDLTL